MFCFGFHAQAAPLTAEAIRSAHRIAIMPGTYDPITEGHLAVAELAVNKGGADMTIITAQENPKKHPIPRAERLKLIALAAEKMERVLYPAEGGDLYNIFRDQSLFGIMRKIRKLNPKAEIVIIVGSDVAANLTSSFLFQISIMPKEWVVVVREGYEDETLSPIVDLLKHQTIEADLPDVSSSKIRKELLAHPEYYNFAKSQEASSDLHSIAVTGLPRSVLNEVLKSGLYSGSKAPRPQVCPELFR